MLNTYPDTEITLPYEEEVNGFTIYIEGNPDRWRGVIAGRYVGMKFFGMKG